MICYRDMTFCGEQVSSECDKRVGCFRVLHPLDKREAEKAGLPICFYVGKPQCFVKYIATPEETAIRT